MAKPAVIFRSADQLRDNASPGEVLRELEAVLGRSDYVQRSAKDADRPLTDAEQAEVRALARTAEGLDDLLASMTAVDRRGVVPASAALPTRTGEYRVGSPLGDRQSMAGYVASRGLVRDDESGLPSASTSAGW